MFKFLSEKPLKNFLWVEFSQNNDKLAFSVQLKIKTIFIGQVRQTKKKCWCCGKYEWYLIIAEIFKRFSREKFNVEKWNL